MKMKKWSELTDTEKVDLVEDYRKTTGPKACEKHGVRYHSVRGLLNRYAPKNLAHGGKRPGSGNKKGILFCGKCRQVQKRCTCKQ